MQRGPSILGFRFSDASIHRVAIWLSRLGAILYVASMCLPGQSDEYGIRWYGLYIFLFAFAQTIGLPFMIFLMAGGGSGMSDVTYLYLATSSLANVPVFDLFVKRKLLGKQRLGGVAGLAPIGATYASFAPFLPDLKFEAFALPCYVWISALWFLAIAVVLFEYVAYRTTAEAPVQSISP